MGSIENLSPKTINIMTGQKFDRIVALAALLVGLVAALPTVYIFQDQRFFWETNKAEQQIQQNREI